MPIVHNGRRIEVLSNNERRDTKFVRVRGTAETVSAKVHRGKHLNLRVSDGQASHFHTGVKGKKIPATLRNLATIQEHYGLNVSESVFLALQLTAKAIRERRALPEVP